MWVSTNQTNGNPRLTTRSKNPNPSPLEKICLTHNSSTSSVDDRVGRVCQGLCNRSTDEGAMGAARLALAKAAEAACPGTGEHTVLDAAATVGNFAAVSQLVDFTGHQNSAALVKQRCSNNSFCRLLRAKDTRCGAQHRHGTAALFSTREWQGKASCQDSWSKCRQKQ